MSNSDQKTVYEIHLNGGGPSMIVTNPEGICNVLKHDLLVDHPDVLKGTTITIEVDEMTQDEIDDLDEFPGW